MLDWLVAAAILILIGIMILLYFDLLDGLVDLFTALAQLAVATITLTITLLALLLDALKRLLKKQHNGILS